MRAAVIAILAACSSSERAQPPAKTIGMLSADEVQQLCERVTAYRNATAALPGAKQVRCGTDALGAAGAPEHTTVDAMRAACTQELARCLASPPAMPQPDCARFGDELATCKDVTVDEMFACTEEMRSMLVSAAALDPCALAMDPEDPLLGYNAYLAKLKGARCAIVSAKCKPH